MDITEKCAFAKFRDITKPAYSILIDEGTDVLGYRDNVHCYGYKEPFETLYQVHYSANTVEGLIHQLRFLMDNKDLMKSILPERKDMVDEVYTELERRLDVYEKGYAINHNGKQLPKSK